jgi:hypothetical protein
VQKINNCSPITAAQRRNRLANRLLEETPDGYSNGHVDEDVDGEPADQLLLDRHVTIYPCLRGWLVAGLPLICTKGGAPGYKTMGRSHLHESRTINTINLPSCSCALTVNLDTSAFGFTVL